jgi:surface protein
MNNFLFETSSKRQQGSYAMVMQNNFPSFVVEESTGNKFMADESSTNRAIVKNPTSGTFTYSISPQDYINNLIDTQVIKPTKKKPNIFKNTIFPIINLNNTFELNAKVTINGNAKPVVIEITWKLSKSDFYNDDRNNSGLHLVVGDRDNFAIESIDSSFFSLPKTFNNNFAFYNTNSLVISKFGGIPLSRNNKDYTHNDDNKELDFYDNVGQFFEFAGKISATDSPTICTNTSFRYLFCNLPPSAIIGKINNWDTSNVKTMAFAFAFSNYNQSLAKWKTFNCISFSYMFFLADKFNQDLSTWNTSNIINMRYMFYGADEFNGNISNWDTIFVTNMSYMFAGANAFIKDITAWNTSNVENMKGMFIRNSTFNQKISEWDTSSVTDMAAMFKDASSFNQDISMWDTSSVTVMASMFENAVAFDKYPDIAAEWNFSNIIPYTYTDSNEGLQGSWGLYNFIYNTGTKNTTNAEANFSTFIQNLSKNTSLPYNNIIIAADPKTGTPGYNPTPYNTYNIDLGYTGIVNKIDSKDDPGNKALDILIQSKYIQHVKLIQTDMPPSSDNKEKTLNEEVDVTTTFAFDKPKELEKKYKKLQ